MYGSNDIKELLSVWFNDNYDMIIIIAFLNDHALRRITNIYVHGKDTFVENHKVTKNNH